MNMIYLLLLHLFFFCSRSTSKPQSEPLHLQPHFLSLLMCVIVYSGQTKIPLLLEPFDVLVSSIQAFSCFFISSTNVRTRSSFSSRLATEALTTSAVWRIGREEKHLLIVCYSAYLLVRIVLSCYICCLLFHLFIFLFLVLFVYSFICLFYYHDYYCCV